MVYLLSVYVERDLRQPMPSLLVVRGRLAVAVSVYVSTSLALAAAALVLLAPLLATLRRRFDLFLPGVAALAVLSPGSAAAAAVFEVLARSTLITTMGRGALKISTLSPAFKALLVASSYLHISRSAGCPTWRYRAWSPWPYTIRGF
jgi:hypothetical protein